MPKRERKANRDGHIRRGGDKPMSHRSPPGPYGEWRDCVDGKRYRVLNDTGKRIFDRVLARYHGQMLTALVAATPGTGPAPKSPNAAYMDGRNLCVTAKSMGVTGEDIEACCRIGLMNAIASFAPERSVERGVRDIVRVFKSHMIRHMGNELNNHVRKYVLSLRATDTLITDVASSGLGRAAHRPPIYLTGEHLSRLLALTTPDCQRVMVYTMGLLGDKARTYLEAAETMGVSVMQVRLWRRKALRDMRAGVCKDQELSSELLDAYLL